MYCKLCLATRNGGLDRHYGHLKQHGKTYAHRLAAKQDPHTLTMLNLDRGPSMDQFRKVWDNICAGHVPWQGVAGVAWPAVEEQDGEGNCRRIQQQLTTALFAHPHTTPVSNPAVEVLEGSLRAGRADPGTTFAIHTTRSTYFR